VTPEDEPYITKEMLEATCLIGTPEQLATRLRALGDAGLSQIVILPSLAPKEDVLRDVATKVMPLLASA
jgi:alkanesulfonate monooxygenase SsuD/methylene tetrahydromethanopterin reductase-like flavin-dependent oxidoreductase (luciferase family)